MDDLLMHRSKLQFDLNRCATILPLFLPPISWLFSWGPGWVLRWGLQLNEQLGKLCPPTYNNNNNRGRYVVLRGASAINKQLVPRLHSLVHKEVDKQT